MEKEIRKYETFEDYLDSLVIEDDQRYLGDIDTARRLVQLGYRCLGVEICLQILHFLSIKVFREDTDRGRVLANERGVGTNTMLWNGTKPERKHK